MEMSAMMGQPLATVLLDYYKFFDSFEPHFIGDMLKDCGVDDDLPDLFVDLNLNAERHIKIGNTYGAALDTSNGLGQGDSLALMSAIIYVAIQHRFIEQSFPTMRMSSAIDDRNLRGTVEDLKRAIDEVIKFDALAGHFTNPKMIAAAALSKGDRDRLAASGIRVSPRKKRRRNNYSHQLQ